MPSPSGADIVAQARAVEGKPYVYGATGPNAFDCSGLVLWCCDHAGIRDCPRTSEEQFAWGKAVSGPPQAGDLVFFTGAELDPPPGHVGIVVSPGVMIDAPYTGTVVQQGNYGLNGTGVNKFMGYRRIPGVSGTTSANPSLIRPKAARKSQEQLGNEMITILSSVVMIVVILLIFAILAFVIIKFH